MQTDNTIHGCIPQWDDIIQNKTIILNTIAHALPFCVEVYLEYAALCNKKSGETWQPIRLQLFATISPNIHIHIVSKNNL